MRSDNKDLLWSERGKSPTEFENGLVARCDELCVEEGTQRWLTIARLIGVDALTKVLDEFGAEAMKVPTRRSFFNALYRPLRDDAIRRAKGQGFDVDELARQFCMSKRRVEQICREVPAATLRRTV